MKKTPLATMLLLAIGCSQDRPKNLGLITPSSNSGSPQTLQSCPDKPNCIISYKNNTKRDGQYLEAFQGSGDSAHDYQKIIKILEKDSSAKVITKSENYIHAEYTSSFMRFVDDVEFYFGEDSKVHFRSASRLGHKDFGANKKRLEEVRFKFQQSF